MNIILYAIPVFFLLIGLELLLEKVRGTHYYRVNDAISSLSTGVLSRMVGLIRNLIPFTLYILVFQHFAFFRLSNDPWVWVLAFIIYDFCYYWYHRFSHEISLFWASHVVHHSSEDYNLTTALRQTSGGFFGFIFYLPMALLGVDPVMMLTVGAINLVYQFWVHTQHVPKLGWLEWIFITPSNHRVHHAQNQRYLDRNYGGVFIVWDRLFGSFQEELDDEKPIYGVRKALRSWDPLWANLQVYSQLCQDSYRTRRWRDKLRVWFGRTGWRPADVERNYPLEKTDLSRFQRFDTAMSGLTKLYSVLQYTMSAVMAIYLMLQASQISVFKQITLALFVIFTCVSVAKLMERRWSGVITEISKHSLVILASVILPMPFAFQVGLIGFTILSSFLLFCISKEPHWQTIKLKLNTFQNKAP